MRFPRQQLQSHFLHRTAVKAFSTYTSFQCFSKYFFISVWNLHVFCTEIHVESIPLYWMGIRAVASRGWIFPTRILCRIYATSLIPHRNCVGKQGADYPTWMWLIPLRGGIPLHKRSNLQQKSTMEHLAVASNNILKNATKTPHTDTLYVGC